MISQAPLSRLETGQYLNDRYEAMEDRLNVRSLRDPSQPVATTCGAERMVNGGHGVHGIQPVRLL